MGSTSDTGTGYGAAYRDSPPPVKHDRLIGPFGPRVIMSGISRLVDGEVTITHAELPQYDRVIRIVTSITSRSVRVFSYNSTVFTVNGTENDDFYWMIVTIGVSDNLYAD